MEQYEFSVFYDGENLYEHAMDAKSVAKSIDSFVTLFSEINSVLHDDSARPQIKLQLVGATELQADAFEAGSFGWTFKFLSDATGRAADLFRAAATQIAERYGEPVAVFSQLSNLIKKINGREVEVHRDRAGNYTLKVDDEIIEVEEHEALLIANDRVQEAMKKIVSPLQRQGITSFGISDSIENKDDAVVKVSEGDETHAFQGKKAALIPRTEEIEKEVACYIDTLSYNPQSQWKLVCDEVNENRPFSVTINDANFLNLVASKDERFAKSDILVVQLYEKRVYNPVTGKAKTSYFVQKVLEHRTSARQENLFSSDS